MQAKKAVKKTAPKKAIKATAKVIKRSTHLAAKTVSIKKPKQKTAAAKPAKKTAPKASPKAPKASKTALKVVNVVANDNPAKTIAKALNVKDAKATKETKQDKPKNQFEGNPYRAGFYGIAFDCLAKMGLEHPVSRKALLEAYCKASGKSEKLGRYTLAVILSPTKQGSGHRSSRKNSYWIERLEDGLVQLRMAS